MEKTNLKACLITTDKDKRGVFMAYIDPADYEKIGETKRAVVYDVRMCVRWDESVRGVIGLAATGPSDKSRVTKAGLKGILDGITAIIEITKEAEEKWLNEPWG